MRSSLAAFTALVWLASPAIASTEQIEATSVEQVELDSSREALKTVPFVDVSKYAGRWYQIARNPLWFEPANCVCAQQTLGALAPGKLSVYNSCNEGGPAGQLREIRGSATNDDAKTNARYTVDFNMPFKGQYWIIGLASDYSWAVVSDPRRLSLYILSKTPTMSEGAYLAAVAEASRQTDTTKLKSTSHVGCKYPEATK